MCTHYYHKCSRINVGLGYVLISLLEAQWNFPYLHIDIQRIPPKKIKNHGTTESWNHRTVELERDLWKSPGPNCCSCFLLLLPLIIPVTTIFVNAMCFHWWLIPCISHPHSEHHYWNSEVANMLLQIPLNSSDSALCTHITKELCWWSPAWDQLGVV